MRIRMFVSRAERVISVTPERAFDRLADLASWTSWMPKTFRVVGRNLTKSLRAGDTFAVKIAHMPVASKLKVSTSDRPRELTWRGGLRGVLAAEHRFLFDPESDGTKTRVRSVETWSGALAGLLRRVIDPVASKVGGQQIEALARSLEVS